MDDALLERLAKATGDLPAMPNVVEKVLRMVQDPETDVDDLQHVIEVDPGLTSKLLRVANSAYYAREREIASLNHAILTLGFSRIRVSSAGTDKSNSIVVRSPLILWRQV